MMILIEKKHLVSKVIIKKISALRVKLDNLGSKTMICIFLQTMHKGNKNQYMLTDSCGVRPFKKYI